MTIRLRIALWESKNPSSGIETIVLIEGTILLAGDQNMLDWIRYLEITGRR